MLRGNDKNLLVGKSLSDSLLFRQGRSIRSSRGRFITVASPEYGFGGFLQSVGSSASGLWIDANAPLALPITFAETVTVYRMGWVNGSSSGSDSDLGIYDLSWNRLVSTGQTACVGDVTLQLVDVTDTQIGPGRYWVVFSHASISADDILYMNMTASTPLMVFLGCYDSATDQFPLPSTLSNMAPATVFTRIPNVQIVCRA